MINKSSFSLSHASRTSYLTLLLHPKKKNAAFSSVVFSRDRASDARSTTAPPGIVVYANNAAPADCSAFISANRLSKDDFGPSSSVLTTVIT